MRSTEDENRSSRYRSNRKKEKKRKSESKDTKDPKRFHRASLVDLGKPLGEPPSQLIDAHQDYFRKHQEFVVYLYRDHGLSFNELTSNEARKYFRRFANRFNKGKLERYYYHGLPVEAINEVKTTRHNWNFRTNEAEQNHLDLIHKGVHGSARQPESVPESHDASKISPKKDVGRNKIDNRRLKEHILAAEEEFGGGRREGHERRIEKKRDHTERLKAMKNDHEAAPEISDEQIYGDDSSSFRAALARERQRRARKEEEISKRVRELQQKEDEKQKKIFELLGVSKLKPGQKIEVAPRKDG